MSSMSIECNVMEDEKLTMMMMMKRRNAAVSSFSKSNVVDDGVSSLPGFRFHPTDEELVGFYLRRKVEKKALKMDIIKLVDVYKYQPWELPREGGGGGGEREMYYFCRRGRKYKNSVRPNRVTAGCGFWKATGIDKSIYAGGECVVVGLKKSLVYYRGSAGKGTKTDWMMHEFRLPPSNGYEAEVWTLCRIFKREASSRKYATTPVSERSAMGNNKNGYYSINDNMESGGQLMAMNIRLSDSNNQCFSNGSSSTGDHQEAEEIISLEEERKWDELRPMVDFALENHHHSIFFT